MIDHFSKLAIGSDTVTSQNAYNAWSSGASSGFTFASFVAQLIAVIDTIIPLLIMVALVIFFVGLIQYIYQSGDARGHGKHKELILWGLAALFVLMSLWGILDLAKTSFFPAA